MDLAAADCLAFGLAVVVANFVVTSPLAGLVDVVVVAVVVVGVVLVLMITVLWWPTPTDPDPDPDLNPDLKSNREDIKVGLVAINETVSMESEDIPNFWDIVAFVVVGSDVVVVIVFVDVVVVVGKGFELVWMELLAINREMGDHKYEAIYDDDFSWCCIGNVLD